MGTVTDIGFEYVSNKVVDFISSKSPNNYSTYANKVRQKQPEASRTTIQANMQNSIKKSVAITNIAVSSVEILRACMPF